MKWKDAVGYEGIYEVSSCGQVRSHKDKTTYSERHGVREWKQRTLKQKISKDNTCRVSLYKNKKERTWLVHRLVAKAFIPMVEGKEYINHIDGSRLNNSIENLEWCNHTENNNHAFDTGLMTSNNRIVLVCVNENKPHYFRSMAHASEFLGYNSAYLSNKLKTKNREIDGYDIFMEANL